MIERKGLLTVKRQAELLNERPKTAYQWAKPSPFPAIKLNDALRYDTAERINSCKKQVESDYNPFIEVGSPGGRR